MGNIFSYNSNDSDNSADSNNLNDDNDNKNTVDRTHDEESEIAFNKEINGDIDNNVNSNNRNKKHKKTLKNNKQMVKTKNKRIRKTSKK